MKYFFALLFTLCFLNLSNGQRLIIDLNDGADNGIVAADAAQLYYKLYFNGSNSDFSNPTLFVSDGTSAGTIEIPSAKNITGFTNITTTGDKLFMMGREGSNHKLYTKQEVGPLTYVSTFDGPFVESVFPYGKDKVVLFTKTDQNLNLPNELYVSDGSSNGTFKLANLNSSTNKNFLTSLYQGLITFYDKSSGTNKMAPMITDGTVNGTQTVLNYINSKGLINMTSVASVYGADSLLFFSGSSSGNKCIVTDGTVAGTKIIPMRYTDSYRKIAVYKDQLLICTAKDIILYNYKDNQALSLYTNVYFYSDFLDYRGNVYFYSDNFGEKLLYRTDGTKTGTIKIDNTVYGNPLKTKLIGLGNYLYFLSQANTDYEIWYTNLDTLNGKKLDDFGSSTAPDIFEVLNNGIVFSKYTASLGSELYIYDNFSVSTKPTPLKELVSVFPNPVQDKIYLKSEIFNNNQQTLITLTSISGHVVFEKIIDPNSKPLLEFDNIPNAGIYLLSLKNGTHYYTKKIIIH